MANISTNKKMLSAGALLLLAFSLIYVTLKSQIAESKENVSMAQSHIPTVFVHGYKGTYNSFKTMLYRFEENEWASRKLVVYVSAEGEVTWKGTLPEETKLPSLIQVVFENNKASISETSLHLQNVMEGLKTKFGINNVNLVGHSMGGLVSVDYLEKSSGNDKYPHTVKLAVIGSPFNGIDKESYHRVNTGEAVIDLKPGSEALKALVKNREDLPADIQVLAIAGAGDQVVEVESAFGIGSIIKKDQLQTELIDDKKIDHSGLHETEKVDKLIKKFLWN
ncbi:alpha/beta hydrolase [Bacillus sp. AK031]